jgi:hypothetical protein
MLKLEKCAKSCHITICLRQREPFFTPLLIKALLFTLLFHLTAIILFHIEPFKLKTSFLHPPIAVRSDPIFQVSAPLLFLKEEDTHYSPPPLIIQNIPFSPQIDLTSTPNLINFPLGQLYHPTFSPLTTNIQKPAIALYVSGDLAQYPLLNSDARLKAQMTLSRPDQDPYYVSYKVRLDEQGKIFWYERTQSSGSKEKDLLSEEILLNTKFQLPNLSFLDLAGWLNFIIY